MTDKKQLRPRCAMCKILVDHRDATRFLRPDGLRVWLCQWCFMTPISSVFYAVWGKDGQAVAR